MSKNKVIIEFRNIHRLWEYAQKINAKNIEIATKSMLLICECSDADLELLPKYGGELIKEFMPGHNHISN